MARTALITGGAGFIGSHAAAELLRHGYRVRALDDLNPQVHESGRPAYLDPEVELIAGDVRDPGAVRRALDGADVVLHLAARVGVGQSMYETTEYMSVNAVGTAVLLEAIAEHPVERLVVASSMSVYGEGRYVDEAGLAVDDFERTREQLERGEWEPERLRPVPTPEDKPPALASVYALGKHDQERMCLLVGAAYEVPTVALRLFNAYGPYQALSNPYTGVLAIFAARLLNGRPPLIFEDGGQRRDFVSVHDAARACRLAVERDGAAGRVINIGAGTSASVREVASLLAGVVGRADIEPEVTGRYRVGDVRHCFADVRLAAETLGYEPAVTLDDGLGELAQWLEGETATDRVARAADELADRGLTL